MGPDQKMQRDQFSLELADVGWLDTGQPPIQPRLCIQYDGEKDALTDRFRAADGAGYRPDDLDVFYRLQASERPPVEGGVLALSDSATGEYLFEVTVAPDTIERFVHAMRQYAETVDADPRYAIDVRASGQEVGSFEKELFLVYGADGTLLRHRSLIPEGIEI